MNEITPRVEETRDHIEALAASAFASGDGAASFDDHDLLAALRSLGSIVRFAEACTVECVAEVLTRSASAEPGAANPGQPGGEAARLPRLRRVTADPQAARRPDRLAG